MIEVHSHTSVLVFGGLYSSTPLHPSQTVSSENTYRAHPIYIAMYAYRMGNIHELKTVGHSILPPPTTWPPTQTALVVSQVMHAYKRRHRGIQPTIHSFPVHGHTEVDGIRNRTVAPDWKKLCVLAYKYIIVCMCSTKTYVQ